MRSKSPVLRLMIGAAAGSLIALAVVPATRDTLVRSAAVASGTYAPAVPIPDNAAPSKIDVAFARSHPNDLDIQIAQSAEYLQSVDLPPYTDQGNESAFLQLQSLVPRFSKQPALYAALLCSGSPLVELYERNADSESQSGPGEKLTAYQVARVAERNKALQPLIDSLINDAECAEALDPNNAFFPWMEASIQFALGRNRDAVSQMILARQETGWDEYSSDQVDGITKIVENRPGIHDSLMRSAALYAAMQLPQESVLRHGAESALGEAQKLERAGHLAEGISIRRAVMRAGSSMRRHASSVIGVLVGVAIESVAYHGLGGGQAQTKPAGISYAQWNLHNFDLHAAFLRSHGYQDEAAWDISEYSNSHILINSSIQALNGPHGLEAAIRSSEKWLLVTSVVLANAAWLLILASVVSGFLWLLQGANRRRRIVAITAALVVTGALLFLLVQVASASAPATELAKSLFAGRNGASLQLDGGVEAAITATIVTAVPILLIVVSALRALVIKPQSITTAVHELRNACVGASAVLLLIFAAIALPATTKEQIALSDLRQSTQNELAFDLKVAGVKPPVDLPAPPVQTAAS